jgi:V-type H+-transporting ATPase subunit a
MTIGPSLKMTGVTGVIMIVVTFYMFFFLSIAVLIVMEGVSAMLHCEFTLHLSSLEYKFADYLSCASSPSGLG